MSRYVTSVCLFLLWSEAADFLLHWICKKILNCNSYVIPKCIFILQEIVQYSQNCLERNTVSANLSLEYEGMPFQRPSGWYVGLQGPVVLPMLFVHGLYLCMSA